MENTKDTKPSPVEDNKRMGKLRLALAGTAMAVAGVVGFNAVRDGDEPKPTNVPETTTTQESTTLPQPETQPDDGASGGIIVTPENPDVNQPATETQPPEATVEGDNGPTSVIVTPENTVETETPVNNE